MNQNNPVQKSFGEILVIDDTPANLQLLLNLLTEEGYDVRIADSGQTGINTATLKPPDLILLDIRMPGMDGYEVCKKLKENPKTKDIPIIFISALGDIDHEFLGFELGGVDYITKPFYLKIVKARINTHLRLKRRSDLLESLAFIDALTEIPNRRRFDEVFEKEWNRAKRASTFLALILIDIDYFKIFNDHYGHTAGDNCLRSVALCLEKSLHRPGDFIARYGGEEFVAILPETRLETAVMIAEKIRKRVESLEIPQNEKQADDILTISLGVAATIPSQEIPFINLINAADKCLYEAKKRGKNQVIYP